MPRRIREKDRKKMTSFRLSPKVIKRIDFLADELGVSRTEIIEQGVFLVSAEQILKVIDPEDYEEMMSLRAKERAEAAEAPTTSDETL